MRAFGNRPTLRRRCWKKQADGKWKWTGYPASFRNKVHGTMLLVGAGYEPYSESQPGAQHLTPSPRTWHLVIPRLGSEAAFPPTFGDSLPGMDQPVAQINKEAGAPAGAHT